MKYRLLIAIACTALSFKAFEATFRHQGLLFILAWTAYFLILYFWIRYDRAPKALMITGSILGTLSVLGSFLVGLLLALPSVLLMLYVHIHSLYTKEAPHVSAPYEY
ncbi:MAG: hypothetical protein Q4A28_00440 [Brachymonas sp.]|nr:hypothetical protein [Brachymonas sp.]